MTKKNIELNESDGKLKDFLPMNYDQSIIEFISKSKAGSVRQYIYLISIKVYSFEDKKNELIKGCSFQFIDGRLREEEKEIGFVVQNYSLRLSDAQEFFEQFKKETFPLETVIEIKIQNNKTRTASLTGVWLAKSIRENWNKKN